MKEILNFPVGVEKEFNLEEKYKLTFRGALPREVLRDIVLRMCNYGCTLDPEDAVKVAQYNIAVDILGMCGIFPQQLFSREPVDQKPAEPENKNFVFVKSPFVLKLLVMLGLGRIPSARP
jgi:hypothetical protein